MTFNKTITGSALSVALFFLIITSLLVPLYHSHHHGKYHHEGSAYHVALNVVSLHEGLSSGCHLDSHLHVGKNPISVNRQPLFKDQESRQDISVISLSAISPGNMLCSRFNHINATASKIHLQDFSSGLSPPLVCPPIVS